MPIASAELTSIEWQHSMDKFCLALFRKGYNGIPSKRTYSYNSRTKMVAKKDTKSSKFIKLMVASAKCSFIALFSLLQLQN